MSTTCAVCRRAIPDESLADPQVVREHHLRPEERARSPTVMVCRPCHDRIHAVFTDEEHREAYDTADALRGADRVEDYLGWIRGTDKLPRVDPRHRQTRQSGRDQHTQTRTARMTSPRGRVTRRSFPARRSPVSSPRGRCDPGRPRAPTSVASRCAGRYPIGSSAAGTPYSSGAPTGKSLPSTYSRAASNASAAVPNVPL